MASIYYAIYHEKSEQPKLLSRLKEGAAEQKNEQNRETSSVCEMRDAWKRCQTNEIVAGPRVQPGFCSECCT